MERESQFHVRQILLFLLDLKLPAQRHKEGDQNHTEPPERKRKPFLRLADKRRLAKRFHMGITPDRNQAQPTLVSLHSRRFIGRQGTF